MPEIEIPEGPVQVACYRLTDTRVRDCYRDAGNRNP